MGPTCGLCWYLANDLCSYVLVLDGKYAIASIFINGVPPLPLDTWSTQGGWEFVDASITVEEVATAMQRSAQDALMAGQLVTREPAGDYANDRGYTVVHGTPTQDMAALLESRR